MGTGSPKGGVTCLRSAGAERRKKDPGIRLRDIKEWFSPIYLKNKDVFFVAVFSFSSILDVGEWSLSLDPGNVS